MRIAIPVTGEKLCLHFGHCDQFALFDVDLDSQAIIKRADVMAPPHQPGLLPGWLAERGVGLIIAGGMGQRAKTMFETKQIQVIAGASDDAPESIIERYLSQSLQTGENACDH
jgi:ATP-binding protein involved in chromosome partitioning